MVLDAVSRTQNLVNSLNYYLLEAPCDETRGVDPVTPFILVKQNREGVWGFVACKLRVVHQAVDQAPWEMQPKRPPVHTDLDPPYRHPFVQVGAYLVGQKRNPGSLLGCRFDVDHSLDYRSDGRDDLRRNQLFHAVGT
jgi:hypothetical protein